VSCGVGHRWVLDPTLLWLWQRPAATALIRPLAWEPPCASGAALWRQKTKKKKKKKMPLWVLPIQFLIYLIRHLSSFPVTFYSNYGSLAFNPLSVWSLHSLAGAFMCVFISLECDRPWHLFFTHDIYKYTFAIQRESFKTLHLKPAYICIMFIYIYIKAQLLVTAMDADCFMVQPLRSYACKSCADLATNGKFPGRFFPNREMAHPPASAASTLPAFCME